MDKILINDSCIDLSKISDIQNFKTSIKVKRMLLKMGWKGQGLGKYEQGIVKPLIAKKTSEKYGVIINSNINTEKKIEIKNFYNRQPTNIIMLTNILNPDEINIESYSEIKEECEKFGFVKDVKFFQFTSEDIHYAESVRVFIEYDT